MSDTRPPPPPLPPSFDWVAAPEPLEKSDSDLCDTLQEEIEHVANTQWWRIFRQGIWSGIVLALIVFMLFEYHRR